MCSATHLAAEHGAAFRGHRSDASCKHCKVSTCQQLSYRSNPPQVDGGFTFRRESGTLDCPALARLRGVGVALKPADGAASA